LSELPRITIRWILTEYFMNPFVSWGIALLVLDQLSDHVTPVEQFLELLWVKQLYLAFLFPMFVLVFLTRFVPYRSGLRILVRNRINVISAVIWIITICIFILVEIGLSVEKTLVIMSHQMPQTVNDQELFTLLVRIIFIMTLIVIPASHISSHSNIIRTMRNQGILTRDTIDKEKLIPIVWMTFIFLLISFVVSNYIIKS